MKKIAVVLLILSTTFLIASSIVVKSEGKVLMVKGNYPNVGEDAPIVRVVKTDLSIKTIGGKSGRVQVIATVPSIDTPVCSLESKRFDDEIKNYPNVDMTVVSMDLPFADDRFCEGRGIKNIDVSSDFAHREVGEKYGVVITDGELKGLLIRSIFVIGKDGKIMYKEIVPDLGMHPDYNKVMNAVELAELL
ncbi:thiol peroxidase [Candidatus Sulfurimonas baltica]|uniref:Thiol peroxidase n=1 Tax=Candidatus Sulfurimonas baltica TaxID=2740404 RepID=A0A7S7LX88_9BACT|nr:thiol peroxidase [Candidatus Sulfurimonas baltica]QOY53102.1 thiol peroxidase [Candidatus Sulfurimonas baltica]